MAVGVQQLQRRGLAATWGTANPVLAAGELGVTTDTHILKVGDGVHAWADLPVAFTGVYLSATGKAADSELLDGISSESFLKVVDATSAATPNKIALRDGEGQLKVVTAVDPEDAVPLAQLQSSLREAISRTVTAAVTLAASDVTKMVLVNHSSLTAQVVITIPTQASVPIATGSWIDISVVGAGGAKITPASGVVLTAMSNVMPPYGVVRLINTGGDFWYGVNIGGVKQCPQIRIYKAAGGTSYAAAADRAIPYSNSDAAKTYNPDSEWFTIPGTGLATARRVIINKAGFYSVQINWSGVSQVQSWIKINKFTADNTIGEELATAPTFWTGSVSWRGRLAAGESIGGVFYTGTTHNDEADGTSGHHNDLTIMREGE